MLANATAWLWLAVLVTPGWFAVRGWHAGRCETSTTPLSEWLPLALAIGATWSGVVALTFGATVRAIAEHGPTAVRIATWLAVAGVLWLVPFTLGLLAGRIRNKQRGRQLVTIVLKSGGAVAGILHHATAADLTLAEVTVDARRYDLVTVNRCDVELVLRSRGVPAASHSDDDEQTAAPGRAGRRDNAEPLAEATSLRAKTLVTPPTGRLPTKKKARTAKRRKASAGPIRYSTEPIPSRSQEDGRRI